MPSPAIPSWKERLSACFRYRHRLLHVFGAPTAVGAIVAMGAAGALNAQAGLGLGALVSGIGALLAGYYVTAGFDRSLVERLQTERLEAEAEAETTKLRVLVLNAHPEIRPSIERIVATHASIDAVFADGLDDAVERILQSSRDDLRALRDRALRLVELHRRLGEVIAQSDGRRLYDESQRIEAELARLSPGPALEAEREAASSARRTYEQWQAAVMKQRQVVSVLIVIEKNLEEFKLAMALRKADALDGEAGTVDVSELQARLAAAGAACEELVGRRDDERRSVRARA